MCLLAERGLDALGNRSEGGRMRCVGKSLHHKLLLPRGEVELTWRVIHDVRRYHAINLRAERLDCN